MAELNSEPTMEEILSSIKKIIADDSGKSPVAMAARRGADSDMPRDHLVSIPMSNVVPEVRIDAAPESAEPVVTAVMPSPENDDVLELTEMAVEESTAAPVTSIAPLASVAPVAEAPAADAPVAAALASAAAPADSASGIISPQASAVSRNAFDSLSSLIVKPEVHGSDTLEGMVREMLRPMMKEWLDARLPEIVESMVAREIARISGR